MSSEQITTLRGGRYHVWSIEAEMSSLANCKVLGFIVGVVPWLRSTFAGKTLPCGSCKTRSNYLDLAFLFINSIKPIGKYICDIGWRWCIKSKIDNSTYKGSART
jgi:hypothetical protein